MSMIRLRDYQVVLSTLLSLVLTLTTASPSSNGTALVIMGVQKCNAEGGSLSIKQGSNLVGAINSILLQSRKDLRAIVHALDSHPPDHISFASQHRNVQPNDQVVLSYNADGALCSSASVKNRSRIMRCSCTRLMEVVQSVWPDHCIRDTLDSQIVDDLKFSNKTDYKLFKGTLSDLGGYSAFYSNGHLKKSELDGYLKSKGVSSIILTGFPFEFCLKNTALDARALGYEVYVVEDAAEGMHSKSVREATKEMQDKGVKMIRAGSIEHLFQKEERTFLWAMIGVGAALFCCALVALTVFLVYCRRMKSNFD